MAPFVCLGWATAGLELWCEPTKVLWSASKGCFRVNSGVLRFSFEPHSKPVTGSVQFMCHSIQKEKYVPVLVTCSTFAVTCDCLSEYKEDSL